MSTAPPPLFDEMLRLRRRDRAARAWAQGPSDAPTPFFLDAVVADHLIDRLEDVLRPFPDAAVVEAGPGAVVSALRGRFGVERLSVFDRTPSFVSAITSGIAADNSQAAGSTAQLSVARADIFDAPTPPASLDLLIAPFDLHTRNDPVAVLSAARRLLKPDGLFLGAALGGESLRELRSALATAEIDETGGLSPRVAPMAEIRDWGALLQRAGFALPVADQERTTLWHRDPFHLMGELRAAGEANALQDRLRRPTRRSVLLRAAGVLQTQAARADGKIRTTIDIIFLTGWAPAAWQQKPLAPGSATTRLADALGGGEVDK